MTDFIIAHITFFFLALIFLLTIATIYVMMKEIEQKGDSE